jgi:hypothetical protein
MLLRLPYLDITNASALPRLLPGSDRDKDADILALRHQLAVLHRQLDGQRVRFDPADRAWLAACPLIGTLSCRREWALGYYPIWVVRSRRQQEAAASHASRRAVAVQRPLAHQR